MCYVIYLSTDSDRDLEELPSEHFRFERPAPNELDKLVGVLAYPNIWCLASRFGGCSCHYRHLAISSGDFGFFARLDWLPEDEDDVEATRAVFDVFQRLVTEGFKLDVIDYWDGNVPEEMNRLGVSLGDVSRERFLFMEDCRFEVGR